MLVEMDHDPLMDDLFGDAEAVHLPTAPALKGLNQRLDDLSGSSCCQRITYSREGAIAVISADSKSIKIFTLKRSPRSGKWSLGKSTTINPDLSDPFYLVHIVWSPVGADLAAVDNAGRVFIYRTVQVLGQMRLQRSGSSDPDHSLNGVVGFYWLHIFPHVRSTGICWTASRSGPNWSYDLKKSVDPHAPFNPVAGQTSFMMLTRGGELKLLWALPDGSYGQKVIELDGEPSVSNSITHAAFMPQSDNGLLLTTYDLSRHLRVYRININWNYDMEAKEPPKEGPNPTLVVIPAIIEESCYPLPPNSADQDGPAAPGFDTSNFTQLTHLEMLPTLQSPGKSGQDSSPVILATFATTPPASTVVFDPLHRYQNSTSVVCRWQLKMAEAPLLSVLDELNIGKGNNPQQKTLKTSQVPARKELRLDRLSDVQLHAVVVSQTMIRHNTLIAFAMNDGSIQFRFRESLELASADGNYEEVSTLPQSGFSFAQEEPSLHIALSPNYCCAVTMNIDGEVKLRRMEYSIDSLFSLKEDQPQFGGISALLATCVASAYMGYGSVDDLLAMLPHNIPLTLANAISEQVLIACTPLNGGSIDFLSQPSNALGNFIFKSLTLQKCISFHYALSPLEHGRLSANAELAWALFNLRSVTLCLWACTNHEDQWRLEIVPGVVANVRYAWGMISYVLQEIGDMIYALQGKFNDLSALNEYIKKNRSPALLILLCSLTRKVLRSTLSLLHKSYALSQRRARESESEPMRIRAWVTLSTELFKTCPVPTIAFIDKDAQDPERDPEKKKKNPLELLLTEMDAAVLRQYAKAGFGPAAGAQGEEARHRFEMRMFVRGEIPQVLGPVAAAVLGKMAGLQKYYDGGVLYRFDMSFLGMGGPGGEKNRKRRYDALRKTEIAIKTKLRQCPRCGSVAEESGPGNPPPPWLVHSGAMKQCICSASWAVVPDEKDDGHKVKEEEVRIKRERTD